MATVAIVIQAACNVTGPDIMTDLSSHAFAGYTGILSLVLPSILAWGGLHLWFAAQTFDNYCCCLMLEAAHVIGAL